MRGKFLWMGLLACSLIFTGCGEEEAEVEKIPVKVFSVSREELPLSGEFAARIESVNEVMVQPRVSGIVVEKFFTGGSEVEEGTPLYRIEPTRYEAEVYYAQANLAGEESVLDNDYLDLMRNKELAKDGVIAEQSVTTQEAKVKAQQARTAANAALLDMAWDNLQDTVVYSPMKGILGVDDVAVGTYANAGTTKLVTIGDKDSVFATFNVSEQIYLWFYEHHGTSGNEEEDMPDVAITLRDGKEYPYEGKIVQIDRSLSEDTGTLLVKALFPNPEGRLLPGMYGRLKLTAKMKDHAILVPKMAVQQVLDKNFVLVADTAGKATVKNLVLGGTRGDYYEVLEGLTVGDLVIVEGLTGLQGNQDVSLTEVTANDLNLSISDEKKEA